MYCILSAADLSVGFEVQEALYKLHTATINGTFMTRAHVVAHSLDGYRLLLTYDSTRLNALHYSWRMANATCTRPNGESDKAVDPDTGPQTRSFDIRPHLRVACGRTVVAASYSSVALTTDEFVTTIYGRPVYDRLTGPEHRVDLHIQTRTPTLTRAPHGLVGQGFVGNPRTGRRDQYPESGNFTTTAWAEGAIDGRPDDYVLASPASTAFKYSRFAPTTRSRSDRGEMPAQAQPATAA